MSWCGCAAAAGARAFHAQREALVHAEAMLLVDDREAEIARTRTSSWNSACVPTAICVSPPATASSASRLLLRLRRPPASHATLTPSGASHARELAIVLLGEDLGGRHDRDLAAVLDRLQRGERRDDGLAAADVALQQALHRMRLREVALDLAPARAAARASA